jgi:hypothetical protein
MLSRSAAGIRGSSLVMAQLIVCFAYLSYRDGLFVCEIRFFFYKQNYTSGKRGKELQI